MGSGIRSLGSEAAVAERMAELSSPYVAPLTQLVEEMRGSRPNASVPYFDPHSGGVRARLLLLLEAPGPVVKAARKKTAAAEAGREPERGVTLKLTVGWLVGALRGRGPYPVLAYVGEQGSAKSTQARVLRRLVDPNEADLRTMPRDEYNLMLSANHGQVLAFDNVSRLPGWLSDGICRIATGGGFATRTLYSTTEETIFSACKPVILNGIEDFVVRGDLLDRSITNSLPQIPEERREEETRFWARFEEAQPLILGALYDAVATSIANEATTHPTAIVVSECGQSSVASRMSTCSMRPDRVMAPHRRAAGLKPA